MLLALNTFRAFSKLSEVVERMVNLLGLLGLKKIIPLKEHVNFNAYPPKVG